MSIFAIMEIVIIGSGNVATILGRKFRQAGHYIAQVYSRNAIMASELAYEWDTESTNYKSLINTNADIYIIALSDNAIESFAADLHLSDKVVAHTAASVSMQVLNKVSKHFGVFYPLQSLRKEATSLPEMPVFFDGNDDIAKTKLAALAYSISGHRVAPTNDDERAKLHVAAVVVSNFTNHLYALAQQYCQQEGLDFAQLQPLIEETAMRLKNMDALQAQTGPAIRKDMETIEKQLQLLTTHPQLKKLYGFFTESIQQLH